MSRDGRKIEEFKITLMDNSRFPAVLRMTDSMDFILEVNQLTFKGHSPRDLVHQAEMQLENEHGLEWTPIILVDPDLSDNRLVFIRLFQAESRDKKTVWRTWRFDGKNEKEKETWNDHEVETFKLLEGAVPGDRHGGPRLKDRELPYTPERWKALVKLDELLRDAMASVTQKLHDIVRDGDVDAFLATATRDRIPAILFNSGK